MYRSAGKILALVSMMISIVNAQCAASCSFQFVPGSTSAHGRATAIPGDRHACCKHKSIPKPRPTDRDDQPCAHPALPSAQARVESTSTASVETIPSTVTAVDVLDPQTREARIDLRASASPSRSLSGSISILRI